jgi:hypothetical protein
MARDFERSDDGDRYLLGKASPNAWSISGLEMSFFVWAKIESFAITDARLMSKSGGTATENHAWMLSTIFTASKQFFRVRLKNGLGSTSGTQTAVGTTQIFADIWYHVGFTFIYPTLSS